jgi:hypothetical protein
VSDYDDLLRTYASAVARDLPRLARELVERCDGIGDDALTEAIGDALTRAWMAGARFGLTEAAAQAIEQGVDVEHHIVHGPDDDEQDPPTG